MLFPPSVVDREREDTYNSLMVSAVRLEGEGTR